MSGETKKNYLKKGSIFTLLTGNRMAFTLSILRLKDAEESGGHETKLSLTGIRKCGDHFCHGGLATNTGQPVIICKQEPGNKYLVKY